MTAANTPHLEAEVLSFPLSERCFQLGIIGLERNEFGEYVDSSSKFSEGLMAHLRPMARGLSIEVLTQLRERLWFEFAEHTEGRGWYVPFTRFLLAIGHERLVHSGHEVTLRHTPTHPIESAAERWRWLSLTMTPDLLIASCAARQGLSPVTDYVSIGPAHLGHFFQEEGIAQAHLHLGAAMPFEWLWTNLMSRISRSAPEAHELRTEGGVPFGTPEAFRDWLVTAAFARILLASFLWHVDRGWIEPNRQPAQRGRSTFPALVRRLAEKESAGEVYLRALGALSRGNTPVCAKVLRPVLRRLQRTEPADPRQSRPPESLEDIRLGDPLFAWLMEPHGALPETRMMTRALRFIEDHPGEPEFTRLFFQYLRIRNRTYRHLVQQPGTAGLDWFTVHYRRLSALKRDLSDRVMMSSALALESRGLPLRSLEVRTAPAAHWDKNKKLVMDIAEAAGPRANHARSAPEDSAQAHHDHEVPEGSGHHAERGLLLHLLKERNRGPHRRPHIDPRHLVYGCRYGGYYQSRLYETLAIEGAILRRPELLVILRGVDICNLELAEPTWVFLPLLKRLRESSQAAASSISGYGRVRPLQLSLHAGEDFRRLIEGLRRLHEPIEFGALGPGDRMGHAFALALSPELWASTAPAVWQPREERLDDLLWELERYRNEDMLGGAGRVDALHGEIDGLARDIYIDEPGGVEDLLEARRLRHSPGFLREVGYPFMRRSALPVFRDTARRLAVQYLTSEGVFLRGQHPLEIPIEEPELRMLHEAQRFLRQLFARMGITVEANPSSNMLIGDLPLEQHPLFRLQPLASQPMPEGGPVMAAIGDDDPVTFASNLPDEYCYLFYTLLRRGVSVQEAHEWLDQVRRNGLRARFTIPESRVYPCSGTPQGEAARSAH